jgi:phytanoyl-CoA hydroxylase
MLKSCLRLIKTKSSITQHISKYLLVRSMSSSLAITATPPLIPPVTNSISVTASDITSYHENGYHVVPNLLSPSQLEQWRTIILSAVQDRADRKYKFAALNEEDHTNVDVDYYDNVFTQRLNLWQTHESVKQLLLESGSVIGKIAAELEGIDCVRIWHDQALIKEGFANPTAW